MKHRKRYTIQYTSGATGYGWEQEMDTIEEVLDTIRLMYNYTAELWVWDDVKRDHVYWKRVLTYKPEINTINAECHAP